MCMGVCKYNVITFIEAVLRQQQYCRRCRGYYNIMSYRRAVSSSRRVIRLITSIPFETHIPTRKINYFIIIFLTKYVFDERHAADIIVNYTGFVQSLSTQVDIIIYCSYRV